MKSPTWLRLLIALAALVAGPTSHAQLFRAYLSGEGNDTHPCTLPQPCRLLPAALNAIQNGGEVWMLDSANYNTGAVTVGKSATILAAPGVVGSFLAMGTQPAFRITASGLEVALRNVIIAPFPGTTATEGIYMSGASRLTLEHVLVARMPQTGLYANGQGTVSISNSTIRDNGGFGVYLINGVTAEVSATRIVNNGSGIIAHTLNSGNLTTATISDSVISPAEPVGSSGVSASASGQGARARVFLTRSTVEGAYWGLMVTAGTGAAASITVSNTMVTRNELGYYASGTEGSVVSLGNNHIRDNTHAGAGVLTTVSPQ